MILGIDISKQSFDVTLVEANEQGVHQQFKNTASGIKVLVEWLVEKQVSELHVCMEATNIYWEEVAEVLHGEGHQVSVVNPTRIKGFAMSQMRRSKTDKLDSEVIAAFCAATKPEAWKPPTETQRKLRSLERHRVDLKQSIQQHKNRQKSVKDVDVQASLERVIEMLESELKAVETQLAEVTDQHQTVREQKELLLSITGIGPKTAHTLLAEMHDLPTYSNARAAAADAGVTPAQYESGTTVRRRPKLSKVGKAAVRAALYMPAINAMRTNPICRAFADQLRERDKPTKVIICAVMRKLLHLAYGVLKNNTPFDPNYGSLASAP